MVPNQRYLDSPSTAVEECSQKLSTAPWLGGTGNEHFTLNAPRKLLGIEGIKNV